MSPQNQQTALATQQQSTTAISVFDRVNDPLEFIEKMGVVFSQSKAGGCQTPAEGKLMAFACLCKRMDPFEVNREFHLMDGKLTMRSDAMLAEFRLRGGKHKWIATGSDGQKATLKLTTVDGDSLTETYSIQDAQQAGLVKSKSGWEKTPGNMLRARVTSNAIRMLCPEIVAGVYTPEEISDISEPRSAELVRTPEQVNSRAEELRQMSESGGPNESTEEVIDVEVEAKAEAETKTADSTPEQAESPAQTASDAAIIQLELLAERAGKDKGWPLELIQQKNPAVNSLDEMSEEQLVKFAENLEEKLAAAGK